MNSAPRQRSTLFVGLLFQNQIPYLLHAENPTSRYGMVLSCT